MSTWCFRGCDGPLQARGPPAPGTGPLNAKSTEMALRGLWHQRVGVGVPEMRARGLRARPARPRSPPLPGLVPPAGHGGPGAGCLLLRLRGLRAQRQCRG